MGAKTCLVAHFDGDASQILAAAPMLDEVATTTFVNALVSDKSFDTPTGVDLTCTYVSDDTVIAGCYPGLAILVARNLAVDRPSRLPPKYVSANGMTLLHAMHSGVDWFAFAVWKDGVLQRSLSLAPDQGVIEDLGSRLTFELPYWDGTRPPFDQEDAVDDYPFPFHPLELGEAALAEFLGFQIEGPMDRNTVEPETVRMLEYRISRAKAPFGRPGKPWWKFW